MSIKKIMSGSTALLAIGVVLTASIFATAAWAFSNTVTEPSQNVDGEGVDYLLAASNSTWMTNTNHHAGTPYFENVTALSLTNSSASYTYTVSITIHNTTTAATNMNGITITAYENTISE